MISVHERIPNGWLPIENVGLSSNHNKFVGLISVHEEIPDGWCCALLATSQRHGEISRTVSWNGFLVG